MALEQPAGPTRSNWVSSIPASVPSSSYYPVRFFFFYFLMRQCDTLPQPVCHLHQVTLLFEWRGKLLKFTQVPPAVLVFHHTAVLNHRPAVLLLDHLLCTWRQAAQISQHFIIFLGTLGECFFSDLEAWVICLLLLDTCIFSFRIFVKLKKDVFQKEVLKCICAIKPGAETAAECS